MWVVASLVGSLASSLIGLPTGSSFGLVATANAEERLAPPQPTAKPLAPPPMVQRPDFLQGLKPSELKRYFKLVHSNKFKQAKRVKSVYSRPLLKEYHQLMEYKSSRSCKLNYGVVMEFIKAHPHWPFLETIQKNAECSIPASASPKKVLEWFSETPPISPEGKLRHIEALMATGKKPEAVAKIKQLWVNGDFSRRFERRFIRKYSKYWDKQDNIQRLDRLLWQGSRATARRVAYRLDKGYQRLAEARIALRVRRGGVDEAIARIPPSLRGDEGLRYERFRWRVRKSRANAYELLADMDCGLKKPAMWSAERQRLVRYLNGKNKPALAYKVASSHCQKLGEDYGELEWLAGMAAMRLGKSGTALSHFRRGYSAATSVPLRARAAYWAGKLSPQTSPEEKAQWFSRAAICDACFYGQLALKETGGKIEPTLAPLRPTEARFLNDSRLLRLAKLLVVAGNHKQLSPFFYALFKQNPTVQVRDHIIALADSYNRPDLAVMLANRSRYGDGNAHWSGYPVLVHEDYSKVEEALILALIRQESAFRVRARSHAGAQGLMQVMPATARHVSRIVGVKYSRLRLTQDAKYNMHLGISYLRMLLDRYDNSYPLALAAYNAGPGRVDRWIANNPTKDATRWVESIPISETRRYVKEVLSALNVYRARLQTGDGIEIAWRQ